MVITIDGTLVSFGGVGQWAFRGPWGSYYRVSGFHCTLLVTTDASIGTSACLDSYHCTLYVSTEVLMVSTAVLFVTTEASELPLQGLILPLLAMYSFPLFLYVTTAAFQLTTAALMLLGNVCCWCYGDLDSWLCDMCCWFNICQFTNMMFGGGYIKSRRDLIGWSFKWYGKHVLV